MSTDTIIFAALAFVFFTSLLGLSTAAFIAARRAEKPNPMDAAIDESRHHHIDWTWFENTGTD